MPVAQSTPEQLMSDRVRRADFGSWRDKVIATGGCSHPIHLTGSSTTTDTTTGTDLAHRSGHILVPCGTRRASVCTPCADRYAADAFHLMRAGLAGDEGKGIPTSVTSKPRQFVTLTAPSFGTVHGRRTTPGGRQIPCPCGGFHHPADPRLGTATDPDTYDYVGAVLWQAHAGALWHRFTITLARKLARAAGLTGAQFRAQARVSFAKVAEYQRRGLVHFHAVIRIDGPDGPTDHTPVWATHELLETCIRQAVTSVLIEVPRPCGTVLPLVWGEQVDVRKIQPEQSSQFEDGDGEISEARLAGYIAKYATKSTGTTDGADRPLRSQAAIDQLTGITAHHRAMIQTAWDLGGLEMYNDPDKGLKLQRWAHMLGFRGHFLTKSRSYSTTFKSIRDTQADYRRSEALTALGVENTDTTDYYEFPDRKGNRTTVNVTGNVLVVNSWNFVSVGYGSNEERELAAGIAARVKDTRRDTHHG